MNLLGRPMGRYCNVMDSSIFSVGIIDGFDVALETFETYHVVVCDYCMYCLVLVYFDGNGNFYTPVGSSSLSYFCMHFAIVWYICIF